MKGIVSKSTGSWYKVLLDNGNEIDARLRGKIRTQGLKSTNPVVVGDEVELDFVEDEYAIKDVAPRDNYILRKSNKLSKQYQIIASNLDLALLVVSPANPHTPQGFIDRFLVTAEAYHIPVIILINKKDLDTKKANTHREMLLNLYSNIGYETLNVSILQDKDVQLVRKLVANKTVLVTGNSGVGKSTLINSLVPESNQKVSEISKSYNKGKHTTTFAQMFIGDDFRIIDTPGIKDFGIIDLEKNQISHFFPEIKAVLSECKFNNCMHKDEPKCKVQDALNQGTIDVNRYINYLGILEELG
jgi:ribosome biogenesis GTPase